MRVLAVLLSYPPRRRNGAFLTTHTYLSALAARGHHVDIVHTGNAQWTFDGVGVHGRGRLHNLLGSRPDVMIHHHGYDADATATARRLHVPVVCLVHGEHDRNRNIDNPRLAWYGTEATRSHYRAGCPTIVSPPPIRAADYTTTPGEHVTLVGLTPAKGVGVFQRLATRFSHLPFLGVDSAYDRQHRPPIPNVTYLPNTPNMAHEVYSRTRILLMPSSKETFGRVGLEAMCSGIPVIAHPTPGMREAYGDAAVWCRRQDITAWVRVLRHLTTDQTAWQAASAAAATRAAQLDYDADVARVVDAIEQTARREEPAWTS